MAELPPYRNILDDRLNLDRGMKQCYADVVTQVYPLRANRDTLQTFCDHYLNFLYDKSDSDRVPMEAPMATEQSSTASAAASETLSTRRAALNRRPFHFKAAAPFVILQVAHYGSITAPALGLSFAQNEVAFGFPVEWYDVDQDGRETFRDWYMVYPFIFVDDAYSRLGARQQYGWAKAAVTINKFVPTLDLHEPRTLVSVSRQLYPVEGAHPKVLVVQPTPDAEPQAVRFLEVCQRRPFLSGIGALSEAMMTVPRALASVFELISAGSKAISNTLSGPNDLTKVFAQINMLGKLGLRGIEFGPQALGALGLKIRNAQSAPMKVVTVKQFRDTEEPEFAAYTAVVCSELEITKIHDGGLLFDALMPDISGGIDIKVLCPRDRIPKQFAAKYEPGGELAARVWPENDQQPDPVEQLGIEKMGMAEIEECPAYLLRPFLPAWSRVDFKYRAADEQYWTTSRIDWQKDNEPPHEQKLAAPPVIRRPYNSKHGSGGLLEQKGPFTYDPFSARILFLPADHTRLQEFVGYYLANPIYEFTATSVVWVLITNITFRSTYKDRTVFFAVPGRLKASDGSSSPAIFAAYQFTNTDWGYITENEVFGRYALSSSLDSPPSLWMESAGAGATAQTLLSVSANIFVPERDRIIEREREVLSVTDSTKILPDQYVDLVGENGMDVYLNTSESQHSTDNYFLVIALKQMLDSCQGDKAAYQELAGVQAKLTVPNLESFRQEHTELKLQNKRPDYDLLPIVKKLGLERYCQHDSGADFHWLGRSDPGRPNTLSLAGKLETGRFDTQGNLIENQAGITLASRVGTGLWTPGSNRPW